MTNPEIGEQVVGDLLRVERGRADAEEVAALTVLLLGLRPRARRSGPERPERDRHRLPEPQAYRAPGSWR
ncbi:acyl-CoA carboxylase subunit epsilon [Streptomyces sp. NPDC057682]|uniref:acyl-CoA carboxylase subunit epsilon n=1 Tax=unclassified Streptomyces TaxID=2593676 RepID=UPI00365281F1